MKAGRNVEWTRDRLIELRRLYEDDAVPLKTIAHRFGTSAGGISRMARRHGWKSRNGAWPDATPLLTYLEGLPRGQA